MRSSRIWKLGAMGVVALALLLALATAGCSVEFGCGCGESTSTTAGPVTTTTTESTMTSRTSTTEVSTSVSPTEPSSTTTASATTTTTDEVLSSAETRLPDGTIRAMGYIDRVWVDAGVRHIRIDYAEMLTGAEADAAAIDAGVIAPGEHVDNDYFIRNVNPLRREFTVSQSVAITTATRSGGFDEPATWNEFISFWSASPPSGAGHLKDMPWWIVRDGSVVISIDEQYIP